MWKWKVMAEPVNNGKSEKNGTKGTYEIMHR